MFDDAVVAKDCGLKLMQRVVASETFHNAVNGRFDTFMVKNETNISLQGEI